MEDSGDLIVPGVQKVHLSIAHASDQPDEQIRYSVPSSSVTIAVSTNLWTNFYNGMPIQPHSRPI